jgi:multidrug efflux pump subunit AcrA (membrane-fusion protein)
LQYFFKNGRAWRFRVLNFFMGLSFRQPHKLVINRCRRDFIDRSLLEQHKPKQAPTRPLNNWALISARSTLILVQSVLFFCKTVKAMPKKLKDFITHHKLLIISFIIIAALTGILALYTFNKNNVQYIKPRIGEIIESIYGLGKVKTDHVHEVKLGVPSTVVKLFVTEGKSVKKGDPLVRLDDGVQFTAPFSGIITQVNITDKQIVFPQQTLIRLEDFSRKYIEVSLEQQGALRVKPGQSARVVFESLRADQKIGTVSAIFSRNDEFLAHILVPGLDENVLPGMTADIAIEVGRKEKALLIPLTSLKNGQVIVLRDGRRKVLPLKIGSIDGNWAEVIESELRSDDLIVMKSKP